MEQKDIISREDIEFLVDTFYGRVKQDPLLAPQFSRVDWNKHLPVMYNFWSSMMLGEQSYRGNPFEKHLPLPLTAGHFEAWIALFHEVVDDNFSGIQAEEIKSRAQSIAHLFQHKMRLT